MNNISHINFKNYAVSILLSLAILFSFLLCACAKPDPAIEAYKNEVSDFSSKLKELGNSMNTLDPNSEEATASIISILEQIDETFQYMNKVPVPVEFHNAKVVTNEGAKYISEATRLYKEAFSTDITDVNKVDAAIENYRRAMTRVSYLSQILQGKVPEGTGITITTESDNEFEPIPED